MTTTLKTKVGRTTGSAESRRLRSEDHIPAVIYGHGMTPVSITVERRELRAALLGPAGVNTDRKSTRLNSSHSQQSRMPSSA